MVRTGTLIFLILLAGCASHPPAPSGMQTDKEFEVPKPLADQFAVRDTNQPPVAQPPKVEPIPIAETVKEEKGKKAAQAKKGKKGKERKEPAQEVAKAPAPIPNRWNFAPIFKAGERTVFDITYFGATAGQLELDVLPEKVISDRPTFHFRAIATSTSVFSLFYRVNDVAESFMDTTGLFSHKFSLQLDESRQTRDVLELYDQQKRKAYYWSKLDTPSKGLVKDQSEIDLVPFTQDGLSAFFFVRTLPLEIGKAYEFPVVNNGKLRTVRVTALRKEELTTRTGDYRAIVVKPEVVLDGVLQNNGDSFLWISDDAERQILKIDAKIKVGSVIAYLRERSYGDRKTAGK